MSTRELLARTLRFLETHGAHGREGLGLMEELRSALSEHERKPIPAPDLVMMYEESPTSDADMIEFARAVEAFHGIK